MDHTRLVNIGASIASLSFIGGGEKRKRDGEGRAMRAVKARIEAVSTNKLPLAFVGPGDDTMPEIFEKQDTVAKMVALVNRKYGGSAYLIFKVDGQKVPFLLSTDTIETAFPGAVKGTPFLRDYVTVRPAEKGEEPTAIV
tara:strand:+ start:508 stop:927 length:420 start_codon:yes stop_codon:yes gene_type:complete